MQVMNIRVKNGEAILNIETKDKNILTALARESIFINAYCGGKGVCRKCKIRYITDAPQPTETEKETFTQKEIDSGFRLACMHELKNSNFIEVFESKAVFGKIESEACVDSRVSYVAVDIGTTTISAALIQDGRLQASMNVLNPQVSFGADVMSRIAYSNEHSVKLLVDVLNKSIKNIIDEFIKRYNINKIEKITVSANPTMIAFLLGLNPESIGKYPYNPPFKGSLNIKWKGLDVYIPPVISAFIGSDITAGLVNIDLSRDFLFIDIGTNCEFVLKRKNRVYAASVPGGPALEGAGIDYGMMAKEGAIERVAFSNTLQCSTIGNKKPIGIAGSGLISAIALLNRYGIIDKSGRILDAWEIEDVPLQLINRIRKEGFLLENGIYLTQNSIREFQLVKAALNAGVEILIKRTKSSLNDIDGIYISGGFTRSLSKNDIVDASLLNIDREFVSMGNSSLSGAMKLFCRGNVEKLENFAKDIEYVEIANEDDFQKLYIKYMDFL